VRRIINSTYITLDGVIHEPQHWPSLGSAGDEGNRIQTALLERCGALLMGRLTYEVFAPVWTARAGDPAADRMNALPKYVVSTTLTDPEWPNTTVLADDPIAAIRDLRARDGGDIVQYGFGPVAHELVAAGLLDELRLWVHPFLVGTSSPDALLHRAGSSGRFELADTTSLPNGVVILDYRAGSSRG
jgi:dihydrofolate reductase